MEDSVTTIIERSEIINFRKENSGKGTKARNEDFNKEEENHEA